MSIESKKDYYGQIEAGKQIITDYLQKERPDYAKRINGFEWVQSSDDKAYSIHRLVIYIGADRSSIKFEETHLADAPATQGVDRLLKEKIDQFFKELEMDGNIDEWR